MAFTADTEKIKRWRQERQWSQEHLAHLAGIGLRTLQRLENDGPASSETLRALAAAYDVDVMALMIDEDAQALRTIRERNAELRKGIQISFWIHLAAYGIGMVTFLGIGLAGGGDIFVMRAPMVWWTVGLAAHAGTVGIIEAVTRYNEPGTVEGGD